eukprot:2619763-Ditylum_brightwellii.AAC.1
MSIALWTETGKLWRGWIYSFVNIKSNDIFSITSILDAIVMPQKEIPVKEAVRWSSLKPILPVFVPFFVSMAVIAIVAETVNGIVDKPKKVGLTDFYYYFQKLKGGCVLWDIALLAAGQSSAIKSTYMGQYIMDGCLHV